MRTGVVGCALFLVWTVGVLPPDPRALAGDPRADFDVLLRQGRFAAAEARLDELRLRASEAGDPGIRVLHADLTARYRLTRGQWHEAAALPTDDLLPETERLVWLVKGLAAARASWPGGTGPRASLAAEAAERLAALGRREGRSPGVDLAHLLVRAALAAAQEERQEMALLLTQVLDLDDRLPSADGARLSVIPVRELAGDLWLQVARYADAAREYGVSTEQDPGRARSWLGLARASARGGETERARRAYARFLELWTNADPGAPELAEARAF